MEILKCLLVNKYLKTFLYKFEKIYRNNLKNLIKRFLKWQDLKNNNHIQVFEIFFRSNSNAKKIHSYNLKLLNKIYL